MIDRRTVLLSLGAILSLNACAAPAVPKVKYFRLIPEFKSGHRAGDHIPATLEIGPFSAEGIAGDRPLLYSANEGRTLLQRNYAYWSEPPTQMLRTAFLNYLRDANLFKSVILSELRSPAEYSLRVRLGEMYQKVTDESGEIGTASYLALEISLLSNKDDRLVLQRRFEANIPLQKSSIDEAAEAMNKGLEKILDDFGMALGEVK